MNYYIITKIEMKGADMVQYPFGYTTSEEDSIAVVKHYDECIGDWILTNIDDLESGVINISELFETNPLCYSSSWTTTNIEGMGLTEIIDITTLI